MIEYRVLWKLIILELFLFQFGICQDYMMGFNDGMTPCKDYENNHLIGDSMKLAEESEDDEKIMYLKGYIDIRKDINTGTMMDIKVDKDTEMGSETVFTCSMDLCESIKDKDAPWAAALQSMNITGCPVETGKYYCDNFKLDLGFLKDKLNHEWEGTYGAVMELKNDMTDVIACHMMGLAIEQMDSRK